MRKLVLGVCSLVLCVTMASAKDKISSQWKCDGKPSDEKSLAIPGQEGRAYHISQGKCTAEKGAMGDAKEQDATWTQFDDVSGNQISDHGVFVVDLSTGDKVFYHYQGTQTLKDGKVDTGANTWTLVGGTGKFSKVTGKGSCKGSGTPDGSSSWTCTGDYSLSK